MVTDLHDAIPKKVTQTLWGTWRVFELSFYSNPDCETGMAQQKNTW